MTKRFVPVVGDNDVYMIMIWDDGDCVYVKYAQTFDLFSLRTVCQILNEQKEENDAKALRTTS